jgi:hypothetical protein
MKKLDAIGVQGALGKASVEVETGRNRRSKGRFSDLERVVDKVCEVTVEELERQLATTAQAIYNAGEVRIKPTWPWVLIRLVPKEQQYGSLYLPDNAGSAKQHKPLWEGIVLETWAPHWSLMRLPQVESKDQEIWRESDFKRGDRVLFPHFAGLPVKFLDENNYRLIREWTFDPHGGALGIVHYDGDKKYKKVLDDLFEGLESVTLSGR